MARKTGLGKGLDALIPGNFSTESSANYVPLNKISPNPRQPRNEIIPAELQNLAESIRIHGILQPLVVSYDPAADHYTLIAGERRWRAAQLIGLQTVPVIVRSASDQERLELALIENIQRANLSPLETAEAYAHLAEEFGLSHEEIAQRVGKSREAITNTLGLLKLAPAVRQALAEGRISEGHARALKGLPAPQAQESALEILLKNDLSVRQTEELVRRLKGERTVLAPRPPMSPELRSIEQRLESALGTRVTLKHGTNGGAITIRYYSQEELDSLLTHLLKE